LALGDQENRNFLFGLENGTIVRPLRIGEFEKVLRRLYRLAGIARVRFLRRRALVDILTNPGLAERICDYIRSSGTASNILIFPVQSWHIQNRCIQMGVPARFAGAR
jgi:hypothetical protein